MNAHPCESDWETLDHRRIPSWFQDAKFGIFIHWGLYSVPSWAPVDMPHELDDPVWLRYAEWYWHSLTTGKGLPEGAPNGATWRFHQRVYGASFTYEDFAPLFRAELFDGEQWAEIIRAAGARYVVLTSKHHDGFALWPSAEASKSWGRAWNSIDAGPKRDLVGDLTEAVGKKGLRMGLYYSLYEWYNPLWIADPSRYVREHMHPQFRDVVTRYRPSVIFSDGEWELTSADWRSTELLKWLFEESPSKDEVVVNDRWGSDTRHVHGGYWTTEYTAGMSSLQHPWEESRGIGYSYGYNRAERAEDYHTGRELVLMLADIVSRGGNLLLGIGPTADGRIPVIMEQRLLDVGQWLLINGEAIYSTRPWQRGRQWSAGKRPHLEYDKEVMAPYDIVSLIEPSGDGSAVIDAFLTCNSEAVFAILPRWQVGGFNLVGLDAEGVKSVVLLGENRPLRFCGARDGVSVDLPVSGGSLLAQPAWVLKFSL
jgi:alpha-L-fucosidase